MLNLDPCKETEGTYIPSVAAMILVKLLVTPSPTCMLTRMDEGTRPAGTDGVIVDGSQCRPNDCY